MTTHVTIVNHGPEQIKVVCFHQNKETAPKMNPHECIGTVQVCKDEPISIYVVPFDRENVSEIPNTITVVNQGPDQVQLFTVNVDGSLLDEEGKLNPDFRIHMLKAGFIDPQKSLDDIECKHNLTSPGVLIHEVQPK